MVSSDVHRSGGPDSLRVGPLVELKRHLYWKSVA